MEGIFVFLWWIINFLFKNIDGVWLVSTLFGWITQYIPVVNLPFYYVVGRAIVSFVFWYGVRWQMMGCLLLVVFFSPSFLYLTRKSTFFSLLLPIFYSTKKSRKEKKKKKAIQNTRGYTWRKAQRIIQVNGKGPKRQVKS